VTCAPDLPWPVAAFRIVLLALAAWICAAMPAAQQAVEEDHSTRGEVHRLRLLHVPDTQALSLAVVWPADLGEDANARLGADLAVALARKHSLEQRLRELGLESARTTVEVRDRFTLYQTTLPALPAELAAEWLQVLAGGAGSLQEDALQLCRAAAALRADDAEWLFPGEVQRSRARRDGWTEECWRSSLFGDPRSVQALDVAALRARLNRPPPAACSIVALGSVRDPQTIERAVSGWPRPKIAGAGGKMPRWTAGEVDAGAVQHPRVDAAFVAVGFSLGGGVFGPPLAQDPERLEAFLVSALAVEVLEARAFAMFRSFRGGEAAARAPFVDAAVQAGDPLVLLHRRGGAGQPLDLPRGELLALLADLRERPCEPHEVAAAARVLQVQWRWPPQRDVLAAMREMPEVLAPRAAALARLLHLGVPDGVVADLDTSISAARVQQELEAAWQGGLWWGSVVPKSGVVEAFEAATSPAPGIDGRLR
jgi:hypothetical protein